MDKTFDYSDPENHVERRTAMSPTLRGGLIDVPRDAWADDPRFQGEPAFWLQIHRALLDAAAELPRRCERLLLAGEADEKPPVALLRGVRALGRQLTEHAHGHHHIEDHHFFPVFARAVPALVPHLALLDGDHRVLADVLDGMEAATAALPASLEGATGAARRDALLAPTERLLGASRRFDELFRRHIGDEEEICIPLMLRL